MAHADHGGGSPAIADQPLSERFEQYPASNDADDENEESEKQPYQASDLLKAFTVTACANVETKTEETATAPRKCSNLILVASCNVLGEMLHSVGLHFIHMATKTLTI